MGCVSGFETQDLACRHEPELSSNRKALALTVHLECILVGRCSRHHSHTEQPTVHWLRLIGHLFLMNALNLQLLGLS